MRYPAILASVLLARFYSCAKVDELSDENRVTSFVLTGFAPSTAELGDPVIIEPENTTENSTIQIPILYGADGL